MADTIVISAEPPKPISITLAGKRYKVRPVKSSLGVALAQRFQNVGEDVAKVQEGIDILIRTMFGKADAPKIRERLADPEDLLDYSHVIELMTALVEKSTGNPTT